MFGKRDLDRAVVRQKRARRLKPDQRSAERRPLHLRDVIGVIQSDCDEFRGRDRHIDLQTRERQYLAVEFNLEPIRFPQDVHVVAAHFAVEKMVA